MKTLLHTNKEPAGTMKTWSFVLFLII
jgi:hypothetical protein